jgi:hypothetical protein
MGLLRFGDDPEHFTEIRVRDELTHRFRRWKSGNPSCV